jgi:cyclophilin family peptidyl-prolyl cis-trans isomerase
MSKQNIILSVLAFAFVIFIVVVGGTQKAPVATNPEAVLSAETATTTTEIKSATVTTDVKAVTTAVVTTNKGVITLELYTKESPKTAANFVKLAKSGFYNGTRFHRVINSFMIQGGDPLSKDSAMADRWGTGGPGYQFADEIDSSSLLYKTGYKRGVLAMANSGPNTNGSQFFIMHQDYPLPPSYTIFGKVTSGLETVDAIASVETKDKGVTDRPVQDVIVEKIEIK